MYTVPRHDYQHRAIARYAPVKRAVSHQERVTQELKNLGVSWYGFLRGESSYLPTIIHTDEHLGGVVYGHHKDGFVMIVATDRRVIFLDKKPMYVNKDEITYDVVGGVSLHKAGPGSTVTLHTRIKDYAIRTFNEKCAEGFVQYIESRSIEHSPNQDWWTGRQTG